MEWACAQRQTAAALTSAGRRSREGSCRIEPTRRAASGPEMRKRVVTVNDKMQKGYCYELTEPAGRNFDPSFRPELTPKQMLRPCVFCGKYDSRREFPKEWFDGAK